MELTLFVIVGAIAVVSAVMMLISENAIYSALFLILNFACIAFFFLMLNAPFLAMVQVTVYAGAIMVLFLFVVMLLGAEQLRGEATAGVGSWQLPLSVVLALGLLGTFAYVIISGAMETGTLSAEAIASGPVEIGLALFESYVFPFEVASVLLLAAMVGVVVLRTKRGSNA